MTETAKSPKRSSRSGTPRRRSSKTKVNEIRSPDASPLLVSRDEENTLPKPLGIFQASTRLSTTRGSFVPVDAIRLKTERISPGPNLEHEDTSSPRPFLPVLNLPGPQEDDEEAPRKRKRRREDGSPPPPQSDSQMTASELFMAPLRMIQRVGKRVTEAWRPLPSEAIISDRGGRTFSVWGPQPNDFFRPPFMDLPNVASADLKAKVLFCSDEFLGVAESMLQETQAFNESLTPRSSQKVSQGWLTRRRRDEGHDWAIIQLTGPCIIRGVEIDVSSFHNDHPPAISLEAAAPGDLAAAIKEVLPEDLRGGHPSSEVVEEVNTLLMEQSKRDPEQWTDLLSWTQILPPGKGSSNCFEVESEEKIVTHIRLNLFPDGGITRLRVWGDLVGHQSSGYFDLAQAVRGCWPLMWSDETVGAVTNLVMPSNSSCLGECWATRRTRDRAAICTREWAQYNFVILKLASRGVVDRLEVHFQGASGNTPFLIEVESAEDYEMFELPILQQKSELVEERKIKWKSLIKKTETTGGIQLFRKSDLLHSSRMTHLKIRIFPDGAVGRIRAFGSAS